MLGELDLQNPINWDSPLNRGLISHWFALPQAGWHGGSSFRDLCGRNHGTLTNVTWGGSRGRPGGSGALSIGTSATYVAIPGSATLQPSHITVAAAVRLNTVADGIWRHLVVKLNQGAWGSPYASYALRVDNTGHPECWINNGGLFPANFATGAVTISANRWYWLAMTHDGATLRLYQDAVQIASQSVASTVNNYSGDNLIFGNDGSLTTGGALNGLLDDVRIYSRALSAGEMSALFVASRQSCRNEFNYRTPLVVFDMGGAAPITVTPSPASITLTTFAPTVSTPRTVTPATASLTLTTFAPTVSTPRTVTPPPASLTLIGFAPTVSTPRTVTPAPATITLTTFAPTVSTPRTVTPAPASLTLTTFAPTVNTPRVVTPSTATLTISRFAPSILTPVVCTPGTMALVLNTFAPTVGDGVIISGPYSSVAYAHAVPGSEDGASHSPGSEDGAAQRPASVAGVAI